MKVILPFISLLLFFIIIECDSGDQKYYFQLYPSQDKDKPYLFYAYTPPSNFMTINTTEKDNCTIIDNSKTTESAIKNLSSVIIYNNDLVIKTCFNPDILVEIKNASTNEKRSKILSNVKYCYSTAIYSPMITVNQKEYAIITYWIEYELKNGKEMYTHKCILYYINSRKFSEEIFLKTTQNFYSEKCINLRNTDIFCSISSDEFTYVNYFAIETKKLFTNNNNHLVTSNVEIDKDVYQKIMATNLGLYDNLREYYYDIFIIEYHIKKKDVTKLNFRLYKKGESKTLSFKDAKFHSGELYIEQTYIEPNLFNMLFQRSNDSIVTYIMKSGKKTNYLLSRFNLTKSTENKNSTQLISNYLREDICSNPKYMQSSFMTSFINYNLIEQSIIKKNGEQNYYKYQKDLVSLITCLNKDNKVEYEPKKIVLPQCLNTLDELNNKKYHIIEFTPEINSFKLDISNDPIYRSLKNVGIQFLSPEITDKIVINYKKTNTDKFKAFGGNQFNEILTSISEIIFTKTSKMKLNKPITLYYRLIQSVMSEDGKTVTCHLSSDKCELQFEFKEKTKPAIEIGGGSDKIRDDPICPVYSYCEYCDNGKCKECKNIEGIILNKDLNRCICDVRKGFKEDPDEINNMCICKEGYSFYKNRKKCLPNNILKCKCYIRDDDLSLIPIYDDCPEDKTILEEDGECAVIDDSLCFDMNNLDMNLWFKLEEYKFYYAKINKCVYIFDGKNLTLFFYSNREDCAVDNDIMIQFIRNCLNKPEITGVKEYMNFLNSAKEYDPNATDVTIFKKVEKKDSKIKSILFNLVNGQSQENVSEVILPDHIISEIKNISNIPEELNLLLFKGDMIRNDTISTQVEYQFYNPIPSKIHQKIIFEKNLTDTNLRRLDDDDDDNDDDDDDSGLGIHIKTDDFEVKLNLPIQWSDDEFEIIEDLYKQKHIFIFDSSNPFYLDVCYKFTTSYNADIYLQDRKEKYYIHHPFCEEGCYLIDAQNYNSSKITCQCSLKEINDNYTNISFYEIEPVEEFNKTYTLPNLKVMGCIGDIFNDQSILKSSIFYINFAIVIVYIIFYCFKRIICKNNNPFKDIINTIEKELDDFKTIYLDINQKKESEEEEESKKKNDEEHHVDQTKYKEVKDHEEKLVKIYDDDIDYDFDENKPLTNEKKEQNEVTNPKKSIRSNKKSSKNLNNEKKNDSGNNPSEIGKKTLSDNKRLKKDKDGKEKKQKDNLNENKELIDKNDINSKYNNKEEENNGKGLIDINDNNSKNNNKEEENINKELIDINDNNSKNNNKEEENINKEPIDINDNNNKEGENNNNELIDINDNNYQNNGKEGENNNKELININDNNSKNINKEEENKNKILIDTNDNDYQNNDSENEIKIMNLININNNNSKNNDNEKENKINDLIQGDHEKDKSLIKKEPDYEKDSEQSSIKDFSRFEPSNFDKESENDFIPRNSKINDNRKSKLSYSKNNVKKSLEFIFSSINNEDDKNLQNKANPPKGKKKNKSIHIEQKKDSKRNNTSVNDNNMLSKIYEPNDSDNQGSRSSSRFTRKVKDHSDVEVLLEKYKKEKEKYSEKIIDRVEYKKALVMEKDLASNQDSSKQKERARSLCEMCRTMISHNFTIIFVFRPGDKNDCFTKIAVGILSACLYVFVNLLIMIKGPSLHLYLRKDKGKFDCISFFVNLFLPYFIFYFSILKLKKDLSIEEFLNENYYELYSILYDFTVDKKHLKKSKNNAIEEKDANILTINDKNKVNEKVEEKPKKKKDEENEKNEKNEILNELRLKIHNLEAKISKKKNEYQKESQKLFWGGLILILLNFYYMCCFLGIYENSYDCLAMNLAMSVFSSIIVSFSVYLISSSFRRCSLVKKCGCLFSISEFFNPQNKYFCCKKICSCCCSCFFFKHISCICSKICCCWYNEKEIEDYIEQLRRKQKEKKRAEKLKKAKEKIDKNLKINDNNENIISSSESNLTTNKSNSDSKKGLID